MATLEKRIESLERVQPGVWAVEWMVSHGEPTPEQSRVAEQRRAQGVFVFEVCFVSAAPRGEQNEAAVGSTKVSPRLVTGDPRGSASV